MEALAGTPYLLEAADAGPILDAAVGLAEKVRLLRIEGKLDDKTLGRLRSEWGVRQVYESAGIEGNQLDLNETQLVIQRGVTISGKPPKDSAEVLRLHQAHEYLETLAANGGALGKREVLEIHSLVVGDDDPQRGSWRKVDVQISRAEHKPPLPATLDSHMEQYFAWLERSQEAPPILRAAVCHAWLVHIHPFADGNGRTSRALGNLLLIRAGYPIVVVRRKDRPRYYEALARSDQGDIGPFLQLLLERSSDSLAHIDRIRQATTGISLALQRIREQELSRFRLWADGLRLLSSTVEHSFQELTTDPDIRVDATFYGLPDEEDFRKISERDSSGNSWLLRVTVTRRKTARMILFWIGFSSDELGRGLGINGHIPSVKISVPNPEGSYPPWRPVDESFEGGFLEIAYHEGSFVAVVTEHGKRQVRSFATVVELANQLVVKLITSWFS
jgi:Fic family protein